MTIDAMGCQRKVAAKIVAGGADYVLAVKGDNPALHEAIMQLFDAQRTQPLRSVRFAEDGQTGKKAHGRIETRRCVATDMIDWLDEDSQWAGLRSVAMVQATREVDGRVSLERRYYMSSLPADPKRINEVVRVHWPIENSMHWVLDVAFGEDQCRARVDNAAQNFAILCRFVSNLLHADKATKVGIKNKRLKAGFDEHYRARVLYLASRDALISLQAAHADLCVMERDEPAEPTQEEAFQKSRPRFWRVILGSNQ